MTQGRATKPSKKQMIFIDEYLIDLNGSRAARAAGYSSKSAGRYAVELLSKPHIKEVIDQRLADRASKSNVKAERVLQEIARIALFDPTTVLSWGRRGVKLRPSDELTEAETAAIAEISETVGKGGRILLKVKFHAKLTALELLGRNLKLWDGEDGGGQQTTVIVNTGVPRPPSDGQEVTSS